MPSSKACSGFLAFIFLLLLSVVHAGAQTSEAVKVAVLPFEVNADEELRYLQDSLPELLRDRLESAGFELVDPALVEQAMAESGVTMLDLDAARQLALSVGASYSLYGTFSQLGEALSLEARFVDAFGLEPAVPIFSNKDGLINLLPLVDEVVAQVKSTAMSEETIASIDVEGTRILDKDVVLIRLSMQKGDTYDPKEVNEELKTVYALGYFDDVKVLVSDVTGGKRVVFQVTEKPRIQSIGIRGNDVLGEDDILEIVSSKIGAVLNPNVLRMDLATISAVYKSKGYYKATVDYKVEGGETGQAKLLFNITEGDKLYIKEIIFDGVEQLDVGDLKDELALSEKGFFWWIDDSGVLNEELLDRDGASVQAYYANRGFLNVKVARPEVDFRDDGIYVTFRVSEGERYKIGMVDFKGDLIASEEELKLVIVLDDSQVEGEYVSSEIVRNDIEGLTNYYNNSGYAYADVGASFKTDEENLVVDVLYHVSKHQRVHIRRVFLEGNTATRDNVILRSLQLADGDQYSGVRVERSIKSLESLNYFSGVDIEPIPTGDPAEMDLKVAVQEKPTGAITGGFGYSSSGGAYVAGAISERNLLGKGYNLSLSAKLGGSTNSWELDFYNPRVNDTYWGFGFGTHLTTGEFEDYDKESLGAGVRAFHAFGNYSLIGFNYALNSYTIKNVDADAADSVQDAVGVHLSSSVGVNWSRSTVGKDSFFVSRGMKNAAGVTVGGGPFGGDDRYVKWGVSTDYYKPVAGDLVFHVKGAGGFLHENYGGQDVPLSQRYYLGGMSSVRGYSVGKISPRDESGDRIGGNKYLTANMELLYPLDKEFGVLGLLFFDAGNAWKEGESFFEQQTPADETYANSPSFGLFKSVGAGLRWMSPMGPLCLEYGFGLDDLDDSGSSKFEFSMGQAF